MNSKSSYCVLEQARRAPPDVQPRRRKWRARELQIGLLQMIQIQVAVAAGPDELAGGEVALLRDHAGQQRVGGDVERHAEEHIGAALVELAGQPAGSDVELKQRVAGRERHLLELADVPGAHQHAARIRIGAQLAAPRC